MPRPSMSPEEVQKWEDRLRFSHHVWEAHGLIANRVGSSYAAGSRGEEIWHYLRAYRGDQWDGDWGGVRQGHLGVTTLFFSAFNTWSAGLLSRNPKTNVLPRLRTASQHALEVAKDAISFQALLNYDVKVLKMKRQFNRALLGGFFSPSGGFIRHGFTPQEEHEARGGELIERYAMAEPDRPWIRAVRPWDIRIDPISHSFEPDEDAMWVAFRSIRTMEEVRRNPNLVDRKDLKPNLPIGPKDERGRLLFDRNPDVNDYLESWVFYEKQERTWFEIVPGLDKPLRERDDWPIPWKDLPYDHLTFNEQMDSQFQVPYAASIWPAVVERNKLRTILMELAKRLRRIVLLNEDGINDEDMAKLLGFDGPELAEFIRSKGGVTPQEVLGQVQLGGIDPSLLALDGQYVEDVREALGQSSMDRAQRINVETAQEAAQVQQGSAIAAGRNQERLEDFLSSAMRHYAIARQYTTTEDEIIPILGVDDARVLSDNAGAEFFTVSAEQIRREYDFEIEAGSTLPRNRGLETSEALQDISVAMGSPEAAKFWKVGQLMLRYALARGLNPVSVINTPQEMQRKAAAQQGQSMLGIEQDTDPGLAQLAGMLAQGQKQ